MFVKDTDDGLLKHKNGLTDPNAKLRWLTQRAATYDTLWKGLEKLKAREHDVATGVLFELLHEWPPERETPTLKALRDVNKIGLVSARDVSRGLRDHKKEAARYLEGRLRDTRSAEIEKALTWIANTLR